ncbi:MAG: hypothetical protein GKR90_08610 [Pseudomonadales bacterium]|nr:hypothetical protein [Pseudomonadales bacterium]
MDNFNIEFEPIDIFDKDDAQELLGELKENGADAEVTKWGKSQGFADPVSIALLLTVGTASAAALALVVTFLHKAFHRGVLIDLRKIPPVVQKNLELPRGSVLIIDNDGNEEFREGLTAGALAELLGKVVESGFKATKADK